MRRLAPGDCLSAQAQGGHLHDLESCLCKPLHDEVLKVTETVPQVAEKEFWEQLVGRKKMCISRVSQHH